MYGIDSEKQLLLQRKYFSFLYEALTLVGEEFLA